MALLRVVQAAPIAPHVAPRSPRCASPCAAVPWSSRATAAERAGSPPPFSTGGAGSPLPFAAAERAGSPPPFSMAAVAASALMSQPRSARAAAAGGQMLRSPVGNSAGVGPLLSRAPAGKTGPQCGSYSPPPAFLGNIPTPMAAARSHLPQPVLPPWRHGAASPLVARRDVMPQDTPQVMSPMHPYFSPRGSPTPSRRAVSPSPAATPLDGFRQVSVDGFRHVSPAPSRPGSPLAQARGVQGVVLDPRAGALTPLSPPAWQAHAPNFQLLQHQQQEPQPQPQPQPQPRAPSPPPGHGELTLGPTGGPSGDASQEPLRLLSRPLSPVEAEPPWPPERPMTRGGGPLSAEPALAGQPVPGTAEIRRLPAVVPPVYPAAELGTHPASGSRAQAAAPVTPEPPWRQAPSEVETRPPPAWVDAEPADASVCLAAPAEPEQRAAAVRCASAPRKAAPAVNKMCKVRVPAPPAMERSKGAQRRPLQKERPATALTPPASAPARPTSPSPSPRAAGPARPAPAPPAPAPELTPPAPPPPADCPVMGGDALFQLFAAALAEPGIAEAACRQLLAQMLGPDMLVHWGDLSGLKPVQSLARVVACAVPGSGSTLRDPGLWRSALGDEADCRQWWLALLARHRLCGEGASVSPEEFHELVLSAFRALRDRYASEDYLRNLRTTGGDMRRLWDRYEQLELVSWGPLGTARRCRSLLSRDERSCQQIRKGCLAASIDQATPRYRIWGSGGLGPF